MCHVDCEAYKNFATFKSFTIKVLEYKASLNKINFCYSVRYNSLTEIHYVYLLGTVCMYIRCDV